MGPPSPYLDEKLPAQRVVVLVGEDLRELMEGAEALPAQGQQGEKLTMLPCWDFLLGLSSAHPNDPTYAQLLAVWELFQGVSHGTVR